MFDYVPLSVTIMVFKPFYFYVHFLSNTIKLKTVWSLGYHFCSWVHNLAQEELARRTRKLNLGQHTCVCYKVIIFLYI